MSTGQGQRLGLLAPGIAAWGGGPGEHAVLPEVPSRECAVHPNILDDSEVIEGLKPGGGDSLRTHLCRRRGGRPAVRERTQHLQRS